ncbi:MAG: TonB-dependent receptor [Gemmatimonadota bacterium]
MHEKRLRRGTRTSRTAAIIAVALAALAGPAQAQERTGRIEGRVLTPTGEVARHAEVRLVGIGRRVDADDQGRFLLEVPAGTYVLEVASGQEGRAVRRLVVRSGEVTGIELTLEPVYHVEPILASVGPEARTQTELYQVTDVISGRELVEKSLPSLGETLAGQPGVNSTYYGPGSSRPVIRGLQGDRVRILESGLGSGDVSATGPDHAVAVEPAEAEQIEIIRGPSTLLYGSSAIGGVVNVIDGRIPRELPVHAFQGSVQLQGATVNDERNGSATLSGAAGPLAWRASGLVRGTDDYAIPGYPEVGHEEAPAHEHEQEEGVLPNSSLETQTGSLGASWIGSAGHAGVAFTTYATEYGVPGHSHEAEEETPEAEEQGTRIDLDRRRVDVEAAWNFSGSAFRTVKARAAYGDYRHVELEGGEVGTRFDNDELEARIEAAHAPLLGIMRGNVGAQLSSRDLVAAGEEAFLPGTSTGTVALFLFEDLPLGPVSLGFGARWERADHETETGLSRTADGLSGSLGLNWPASDAVTLAVSGSRSTKLPAAEELFSNGPHVATRLIEVGDPDLENEVGYSADAALIVTEGPVTGQVAAFVSSFDGFIFLAPTDSVVDEFLVARYEQADALFYGFEASLAVSVIHRPGNHLALTGFSDYVRAEAVDTDRPLPRIPPLRWGIGARWELGPLRLVATVRRTEEQDRVAAYETPTAGYTMLNASAGYVFFTGAVGHEITLRGSNLTDEEARNHVSYLKDLAPLPGRDIRLTWRVMF